MTELQKQTNEDFAQWVSGYDFNRTFYTKKELYLDYSKGVIPQSACVSKIVFVNFMKMYFTLTETPYMERVHHTDDTFRWGYEILSSKVIG